MAFNKKSTAEDVSAGIDLHGRNIVVTGANTGIGKETARVLALRGAHVTLACRNADKAAAARADILASAPGVIEDDQLECMPLDLGQLESVRTFAGAFNASNRPLHCLVNNAGLMSPTRRKTADGFEAQYGTNHLGHFLLTNLLLPSLRKAGGARVVVVASSAMIFSKLSGEFTDLDWLERPYKAMQAYGDSKLMNALFAREFQARHRDEGIVTNFLHPGIIATELGRDQTLRFRIMALLMLPVTKTIPQGAATTVLAATADKYGREGGYYLGDCAEWEPAKPLVNDVAARERFWEISARATGLSV